MCDGRITNQTGKFEMRARDLQNLIENMEKTSKLRTQCLDCAVQTFHSGCKTALPRCTLSRLNSSMSIIFLMILLVLSWQNFKIQNFVAIQVIQIAIQVPDLDSLTFPLWIMRVEESFPIGVFHMVASFYMVFRILLIFQLLDEGKLQKADNLYEDFQTAEGAHKM